MRSLFTLCWTTGALCLRVPVTASLSRKAPMPSPILIYDGNCGFCSSTVQFILRHERRCTLRFAALQGAFASALLAEHPELRELDSVVWFESAHEGSSELVLVKTDAVIRISIYLGGLWRLAAVMRFLPRALRDASYDFIARRRHRIPGVSSFCLVPDATNMDRFIA